MPTDCAVIEDRFNVLRNASISERVKHSYGLTQQAWRELNLASHESTDSGELVELEAVMQELQKALRIMRVYFPDVDPPGRRGYEQLTPVKE